MKRLIVCHTTHLPTEWLTFLARTQVIHVDILGLLFTGTEVYRTCGSIEETYCFVKNIYLDEMGGCLTRVQEEMIADTMSTQISSLILNHHEHPFFNKVLYPNTVEVHKTTDRVAIKDGRLYLQISESEAHYNLSSSGLDSYNAKLCIKNHYKLQKSEVMNDCFELAFMSGTS